MQSSCWDMPRPKSPGVYRSPILTVLVAVYLGRNGSYRTKMQEGEINVARIRAPCDGRMVSKVFSGRIQMSNVSRSFRILARARSGRSRRMQILRRVCPNLYAPQRPRHKLRHERGQRRAQPQAFRLLRQHALRICR